MTTKQAFRLFLKNYFKDLSLGQSLFLNWNIGLRFDLQTGDTDSDQYFQECIRRASTIFQTAFNSSDIIFLVLIDYRYKKRKIRLSSFTFKQVDHLKKHEVEFSVIKRLEDKGDQYNMAYTKLSVNRINFHNLFTAIAHLDFPSRQPRLSNRDFPSSQRIFFLNLSKNLIFNMYDDRGLDIIASDKEILRPIYKTHYDWILDSNREQIDKLFE